MTRHEQSPHDELGGLQLGALEQPGTYTAKQAAARRLVHDNAHDTADARQLLDALGLL